MSLVFTSSASTLHDHIAPLNLAKHSGQFRWGKMYYLSSGQILFIFLPLPIFRSSLPPSLYQLFRQFVTVFTSVRYSTIFVLFSTSQGKKKAAAMWYALIIFGLETYFAAILNHTRSLKSVLLLISNILLIHYEAEKIDKTLELVCTTGHQDNWKTSFHWKIKRWNFAFVAKNWLTQWAWVHHSVSNSGSGNDRDGDGDSISLLRLTLQREV